MKEKDINFNIYELNAIKEKLDEDEKKIFNKLIHQVFGDESYCFIKNWIENYEKDNSTDTLLSTLIAQIIRLVVNGLHEKLERIKEDGGKHMVGSEGASIAVTALRTIADHVEEAVQQSKAAENENKH